MQDQIGLCYRWYAAKNIPDSRASRTVCPSRDIFQARLDSMYRALLSTGKNEDESALLTAIAGEIGNNCFDHNLGQWRDASGCRFEYAHGDAETWIVIADRGQGVFSSLKRVMTSLKDDREALSAAFQLRVSGRSPEKRGNGLKFVRSVINENESRRLLFLSGNGRAAFGGLASKLEKIMASWTKTGETGKGAFALILWKK